MNYIPATDEMIRNVADTMVKMGFGWYLKKDIIDAVKELFPCMFTNLEIDLIYNVMVEIERGE